MHVNYSTFVILGERETLLVDTSVPSYWPTLDLQLDEVLGDRQLDWVFPTHPEIPHAANLPLVLNKYPGCKAVGDMRDIHVFHPDHVDRLHHKVPGDSIDPGGGYGMIFTDAPFKDLPSTLWGFEPKQRIFFVSDGFAYNHHAGDPDGDELVHAPGECRRMSGELPGHVQPEQATFMLRTALSWMKHIDVRVLFERTTKLLEEYPPRYIAPAHGNVIDNVEDLMPVMKAAYM